MPLLLATPALAQPPSDTPSPPPADATPLRGENFIDLDANGDGALARSELARYPSMQRRFERMDRDRNGSLSGLEFSTAMTGPDGAPRELDEAPR